MFRLLLRSGLIAATAVLISASAVFAAGSVSTPVKTSSSSKSSYSAPKASKAKKTTKKLSNYQTAELRIGQGRYSDALVILNRIVDRSPNNADAWNLIGFSERSNGNLQPSWDAYQKALALNPKHRGANEYLGEWHLQSDDLAGAQAQYDRLTELCPSGCSELRMLERSMVAFTLDGQDVKAVQQALADAGFYKSGIDGQFGKGSRAALRAFQQANNITSIGLDTATKAALMPAG